MDWKENFDNSTLMEGMQIFQNHLLGKIRRDGDFYQSAVYDPWTRTNHLVQAQIKNGAIEALDCSCPAGKNGEFCRHEAAFLFGIEEQMKNHEAIPSQTKAPYAREQASVKAQPKPAPKPEPARPAANQAFSLEDYLRELAGIPTPKERAEEEKPETLPEHHQPALHEKIFPAPHEEDDFISRAFPKEGASPFTAEPAAKHEPEAEAVKAAAEKPEEKPAARVPASPILEEARTKAAEAARMKTPAEKPAPKAEESAKPAPEKPEAKAPKPEQPKRMGASLQSLIDSLSEEQIRSFLFREARNTPAFRQRLELEFLNEAPEELLDTYYSGLDALIYTSQDANGLLSHASAERLLQNAGSWLLVRLNLLLEHDHPAEAFALIRYALNALGDLRFEDVSQSAEELIKSLCGELAKTIQEADLPLSDEIFTWIEVQLSQEHLPAVLKMALLKMLDASFLQERYTPRKLAILEHLLQEENERSKNNRFDTSLRNQLIRQIYSLFAATDQYPQEKAEFEKQAKDSPVWQEMQIQKAIALDDLESARVLLADTLRQAPRGSLEAAIMMRKLAALLKQEGKESAALDTLRALMTKNTHIIPSDLQMLKSMVSEEEFLSAMKALHNTVSPLTLVEVYAANDLDEALMELIEEKNDLLLLEAYESRLAGKFAGRMLKIWLDEARAKAASSQSREYADAIYALKKAASLPEGAKPAASLAVELKEQYPHKRSLLYRIEEAGLLDSPESAAKPAA